MEDDVRHLLKTGMDEGSSITDAADAIKRMRKQPYKAIDCISKVFKEELQFELDDINVKEENVKDKGKRPYPQPPQNFNNVTLFKRMPPGYIEFQPTSLDDLVRIVQEAVDAKKNVKAVGTCYAFSDVSFTTGYLLEMNRYLHNILDLDTSVYKDPSNEHIQTLFKVESGTMVESINKALWPPEKRDNPTGYRVLLNQTGYTGLSIGGLLATGAHGSGLHNPPMVNMVVSQHVITVDKYHNVKHTWLEPSNGITDPEKFRGIFGKKGWELIQDDNTFNSSVCSIGCFGVVYSYVIRVQPAFYLEEYRYMQTWEKTKEELPNLFEQKKSPRKEGSMHSFEIWVVPYPAAFDDGCHCIISTWRYAAPPRKNKRPHSFFNSPLKFELLRYAVVGAAKFFPEFVPEILHLYIKSVVEKDPVTMPCTEALNFGSANSTKVVTSDMGIDASSTDNVIKAIDDCITLSQSILKVNPHQYVTTPIDVRFTAPANANVAPQYNRPTCMVELPILLGTPRALDTLTKFRKRMRDGFNGRPHYGQINDMNYELLKKLFPDTYQTFLGNVKKFNPTCTFRNTFSDSLLGRK